MSAENTSLSPISGVLPFISLRKPMQVWYGLNMQYSNKMKRREMEILVIILLE